MTHDNLRQELVRVFELLGARYGAEWSAKWAGIPVDRLLMSWHQELARFNGSAEYTGRIMDEAMRHLPERAPNAVVFRQLCAAAHDTLRRPPPATAETFKPVRGPTPEEREHLLRLSVWVKGRAP